MNCPYLVDILATHTTPEGVVIQAGIDEWGLAIMWAKHPDDANWVDGSSYDRPEYALEALNDIKNGIDTLEEHFGHRPR